MQVRKYLVLRMLKYADGAKNASHPSSRHMAELRATREKGTIRIIDLLVLKKDGQRNVTVLELSDWSKEDEAEPSPLASDLLGLFAQDDIEQAAANIPNNSAAGLLLIEHA